MMKGCKDYNSVIFNKAIENIEISPMEISSNAGNVCQKDLILTFFRHKSPKT
jgi:hypothetical protein